MRKYWLDLYTLCIDIEMLQWYGGCAWAIRSSEWTVPFRAQTSGRFISPADTQADCFFIGLFLHQTSVSRLEEDAVVGVDPQYVRADRKSGLTLWNAS